MSARPYQITLTRNKLRANDTSMTFNVRQYQLVRDRSARSMHDLNDTNKRL